MWREDEGTEGGLEGEQNGERVNEYVLLRKCSRNSRLQMESAGLRACECWRMHVRECVCFFEKDIKRTSGSTSTDI